MIQRAFLCRWEFAESTIKNPISTWVENYSPSWVENISMHYPDAGDTGLPGLPLMLVIVRGGNEINSLAAIEGVAMLPAYGYRQALFGNMRAEIRAISDQFGVPAKIIKESTQDYGGVLEGIVRFFSPSAVDLGIPEDQYDEFA